MSQPFGPYPGKVLRQSRAAFQRQSRAADHRTWTTSSRSRAWKRNYSFDSRSASGTRYSASLLRPSSLAIGWTRPFSRCSALQATTILQNPRVDEDGQEMTIEISDRAAKRLQQITSPPAPSFPSQNGPQHNHLRVSVTSGGCHGFQYLMSLEPSTAIENDDDTVFASQHSPGSAKVVMDEASLELLKGSTIDYTNELIGSQFKITGNPRAKSSCGCGTSFDIED